MFKSSWWFHFIFYVHPQNWGRWTHFDEHGFQMSWWKTTTSNVSLDRGLTHQWIARSMPWDLGLARPTVGRCILHHLATYPRWGKVATNLDTMHLYALHFLLISLIWCGWGVCVFRDVRLKSFLHEIKCLWVRNTRAPVCFGLLVGTSNNSLAFSPRAPNRKRAGRSHLSSGSFHHRNWARWKCWKVAKATGCWRSARFFACLLRSFRGNIWLEEIVLNVLGLIIHDGKCDHRNWGYYGKEHVQSSCAYHRFYCILVPLQTILG